MSLPFAPCSPQFLALAFARRVGPKSMIPPFDLMRGGGSPTWHSANEDGVTIHRIIEHLGNDLHLRIPCTRGKQPPSGAAGAPQRYRPARSFVHRNSRRSGGVASCSNPRRERLLASNTRRPLVEPQSGLLARKAQWHRVQWWNQAGQKGYELRMRRHPVDL